MKTDRLLTGAYWLLIIGFTGVMWAIYWLMPRMGDDLWYSKYMFDWLEHGGDFPWEGLRRTVAYHAERDNIRLANIFLIPTLLLPKWLAALIPALASGWLIDGFRRLCNFRTRQLTWVVIIMACISFGLPWFENFFVLCFAFNYVVASAMAVWWMAWFLSEHQRGWLPVANALLLGAWNEAFSLPLLVGGIIVWIAQRNVSRTRLFLIGGLAIGVAYAVGTRLWIYSFGNTIVPEGSVFGRIVQYGKVQVPFAIFLCVVLWSCFRYGYKTVLKSTIVILALSVSITAFIMNVGFASGERASTVIQIVSMAATLILLSNLLRFPPRMAHAGSIALGVVVGMWLVAHYAYVIFLTAKIHTQWEKIHVQAMNPGHRGPIFVDVTLPEFESLLAWRKPSGVMLERQNIEFFNQYYGELTGRNRNLTIIPSALKSVSERSGETISGTSDIRKLDGHYFRPSGERNINVWSGRVGPFRKQVFFYVYPFETDSGERMEYLYPQVSYFPTMLMTISELNEPATGASQQEDSTSRQEL